jgi:hypothetical protein
MLITVSVGIVALFGALVSCWTINFQTGIFHETQMHEPNSNKKREQPVRNKYILYVLNRCVYPWSLFFIISAQWLVSSKTESGKIEPLHRPCRSQKIRLHDPTGPVYLVYINANYANPKFQNSKLSMDKFVFSPAH